MDAIVGPDSAMRDRWTSELHEKIVRHLKLAAILVAGTGLAMVWTAVRVRGDGPTAAAQAKPGANGKAAEPAPKTMGRIKGQVARGAEGNTAGRAEAGASGSDGRPADPVELAGTWDQVAEPMDLDGKHVRREPVTLTILGNACTWHEGDRLVRQSLFTLKDARSPRELDFVTVVDGRFETTHALFSIEGDVITIREGALRQPRPAKLVPGENEDSWPLVHVFKRRKASVAVTVTAPARNIMIRDRTVFAGAGQIQVICEAGEITPRTKAILARLEEPVSMEFPNEVTLDDILQHIKRATKKGPNDPGIPIYVDPLGLLEAGSLDSMVTINEKVLPLKVALARVLTPLGMAYIVKDDVLIISVPESTEREEQNEVAVQACDASQETKALLARLAKPVKMPFPNDTPLGDVLEYLKQVTDDPPRDRAMDVLVIPSGLKEAESTLDSTVRMDLEGVPLRTTLRLLLDQLGLACVVKDGRVVIHSSNGIRFLKRYAGGELPIPLRTKPPQGAEISPRTKAILAKLEEPLALEFPNEVPLDDVLQHIKRATKKGPNDLGIPIYVDPLGLLEAGILDPKLSIDEMKVLDLSWKTMARVTINEKGLPLKDTLARVLTSLGLAYMVKDDVLIISDPGSIRRERKELAVQACDASPETKALLARLEKPVKMPFPSSTPLGDVLEYLKQVTKDPPGNRAMEFLVVPSGLEEAQRTLNSTVRMDLEGVPLRTMLPLLLDQLGLACVVKDGRLVIHSAEGIGKLKRNAGASRKVGMESKPGGSEACDPTTGADPPPP